MPQSSTALQLAASAIRLGGVAGKFVVVALLAAQGSIDEIGQFTLVYTLVNVAVFVIGGELHLGTLRLASKHLNIGNRNRIAANNLRFDACVYFLVLTLGYIASYLIPPDSNRIFDPFFLVLLIIADHSVQQLSRWHIFFGNPLIGNVIQGIKAGFWGWILIPITLLGASPTIQNITKTWLVCDLAALAIAWHALYNLRTHADLIMPFRQWFSEAGRVSRNYYLTGFANQLASNFDRPLVGVVMGITELGRYGFWVSLASAIPLFLTSFVGARHFSALLTSAGQGHLEQFDRQYRKYLSEYLRLSAVCLTIFMLFAPLTPAILHKPEMALAWPLVFGICASIIIGALWQAPYQALYSAGDDSWLMWSQLGYMLATLAGNIIGAYRFGIPGLCATSITTGISLFIILNIRLQRVIRGRIILETNKQNTPTPI